MRTQSYKLPKDLKQKIQHWGGLWELPNLPGLFALQFSSRLRITLGKCLPRKGIIRMNVLLLDDSLELFYEVLCHEAAHIAVYHLHDVYCRPHGPEWASLVRAAGYDPRPRFRLLHPAIIRTLSNSVKPLYIHRCPVCQMMRVAARPMRRWRCLKCVESGLDGHLEIATMPSGGIEEIER